MNHKDPANQPPTSNDNAVSTTDQPHYVPPTLTVLPDYVDSTLGGSLPGF